jgi:CheY-like chemotaxis protein
MAKINCILLVDDNEGDNVLHSIIIEEAQVSQQVKIATDGKEALSYLKNTLEAGTNFPKPELIFLDLNMPGMNGFEFLKEYEKLNDGYQAMIVILTSSDDPIERSEALSMKSVTDYINKPLDSDTLIELIKKLFNDLSNN